MIKVLNIITDANIGGAGNVLLNFMRKTNRAEFEHTVIVPQGAQLSPLLRELDINVIEMAGIAGKSFSPGTHGAFIRQFDDVRPDVIHTHASLSARIAARSWNRKKRGRQGICAVVHTRHCAYPLGRLKTSFPMKQALGFLNNRLSDIIIAISPAACDNLTDTGTDPQKIVTMFNGVEPVRLIDDNERNAIRTLLGIEDGQFVCAIIARLVPEKGHMYVLEAADLLRDLPIRFVIAGAGPFESEVRAAAAARNLSNCIFTGFIKDIATIVNIMDVQVNASYGTEASSLSLLEGMSLGKPTVASDFGGNPHHITDGDNGLVVRQHDGKAIADAIRMLHGDPELLAHMGESSLKTYNARFTAAIMAANIESVYRDAIVQLRGP